MVQPTVLDLIAAHQQFRGRGLLARFMYAFPVSKVGHRKIGPKPVSEDVRDAYAQTLTTLTTDLAKWTGDDRIVLTMTPSAHEEIKKIEEALEPTLAADGDMDPLVDWGSKYVGAIARIAGILHLYGNGVDKGTRTPVSAETVLAANRIGEYFRSCAIKAFSTMGTDRITADAVYLLRRIKSLGADEVSERDMQRAAKRFKTLEEMLPAVDRLADHGWIVPLPDSGPTGGRPASRKYRVTEGQKGQNTPPDPSSEGAE
jgi:replicative DNA helicase